MSGRELPVSESCLHCPHLDSFHGTCSHDLRQVVIRELVSDDNDGCPVFPTVRAEAMRELEERQAP